MGDLLLPHSDDDSIEGPGPGAIAITGGTDTEHIAILGFIVLIGLVYALLARSWPRAEQRRRVPWFAAGYAIFLAAESPPVHALSESYLLSAHMAQHVLMTLAAPPLLLLGLPPSLLRRALCRRYILGPARLVTRPLVAFIAFNFVHSLWHVPVMYEAALERHWLHGVEHVAFMFSALCMWWPIIGPLEEMPRLSEPALLLYLVGLSSAQVAITGPLVFLDHPAYETYAHAPRITGMSPIDDQRLAGVLMKIPGTILFTALFCVVFIRWARKKGDAETMPPR